MARSAIALLGLLLAGCAGPRPPEELSGLWSAGPAACAAGVGVRFRAEAIEAVYDDEVETLFSQPQYEIEERTERAFRVRIVYHLPRLGSGAGTVGAHGVLILARQEDGGIAAVAHTLVDGLTGAARVRIVNDPASSLLALEPCGAHPWREDLRGRVPA
ncbi:MAG: hypothetical protein H7124_04355 [Phycisphaerales bacterium]|nr:hypothetical protein [Hyphomonadaceae bacterium]